MKIVVQTQYRENYAAHDWDGEGVCPQGWKCKGGDTYIVEGISVEEAQDQSIWDFVIDSIGYFTDYVEEIVVGIHLEDDCVSNEEIHDSWDAPIVMSLDRRFDGSLRLLARRISDLDPDIYDDVREKRETWYQDVAAPGERQDYLLVFERRDGSLCDWQGRTMEAA